MKPIRWSATAAWIAVCFAVPAAATASEPAELDLGPPRPASLRACIDAAEAGYEKEALAGGKVAEEELLASLDEAEDRPLALLWLAESRILCQIRFAGMMQRLELLRGSEEALEEALELRPDFALARLLYGTLLFNLPPFLDRSGDAATQLELLVSQQEEQGEPRNPEPYAMLGDLRLRGQQPDEAARVWRRGLDLYPQSAALRQRLEELGAEPSKAGAAEAAVVVPAPAGAGDPLAALRALVEAEVERPEVVGMAVAIVQGEEVLLSEGFGFADLETRTPASTGMVMRLGSISKQFLAALILRLEAVGKLSLNDTVSRWLPEAGDAATGVTLEHLLSHRSGLPRDIPTEAGTVPGEWIAAAGSAPRLGEPGERYAYSNIGYALLGAVAERAGGAVYEELLRRHLTEPLGLPDTGLCDDRAIVPNRAQGYQWVGDRLWNDEPLDWTPSLRFAGGLCSTLDDLLRWQGALLNSDGLLAGFFQRMSRPRPVSAAEGSTYGLGLHRRRQGELEVVHHGGAVNGFFSELAYYPGPGWTVAVLANSETARPRQLAARLSAALTATRALDGAAEADEPR